MFVSDTYCLIQKIVIVTKCMLFVISNALLIFNSFLNTALLTLLTNSVNLKLVY